MKPVVRFAARWLLLVGITTLAQPARAQQRAPKPNILYIEADDLGWKDVGFHGSDIQTPNLDQLAQGGADLGSFYTQPLCTPSRAAFLTGRYPCRYGLQTLVILAGQEYGLPKDEWILPQALKDAGYTTAIVGKWHLGHARPEYWPRQRGFDYQYGPLLGEIDYYTHEEHGVLDWYRDNKRVKEPGYVTQLLGQDAARVIEKHDTSKPLFLFLAFTAPHAPYQAPKDYVARYSAIADSTRRTYAAMITCMDDEIGRVLKALDKKGMRDNTLIVFQSDNGGNRSATFAGEIDVSKLVLPSDNGPYRDGKGSLYEGGTRVVALANWPGHIPAGKNDALMHMVDIYPTLMDVAGGSTAKCKPLDGLDMWPTWSAGKPSPRAEVVYNVEPFRAAIRQGDWKLIWRTPLPASLELYDLADDPYEKTDVAAQHPDKVAELQKRVQELAGQSAKPLFLMAAMHAYKSQPAAPPALPSDDAYFNPDP
ncbi:MAG TPA: arylsulfatase [Candidatus Eisenbacteria bacterium]|nr:arylsulfatase [Candidatus Eisenbacteria bacterium]